MSTILDPCFESQFKETAKVLKLKVAAEPKTMEFSSRSSIENKDELNQLNINNNLHSNPTEHAGWSFLQTLSNISSNTKETMEKETVYIHPLSKSASSRRLSDKSLQICTENLGCETGSFMTDSNILSLSSYKYYTTEKSTRKEQEQNQSQYQRSINKVKHSRELPPPLTTMRGEKTLQVKTHREDGRLIIQTIEKPLKESCFHADRSDGCLKLCFLKDVFSKLDMLMIPEENEANQEETKMNKDADNEELQNQEDDDKEIISKENKFQRLSRCKECGNNQKKLCNWEPLLVTTS